ncbi:LuxR family transcriptional regulator [Albidovulum inexpectatum]|uniref:LuxR family transcriptional regulator n=1 Tax=Albidovulum inexpectatum TaxID=196587 RepID=A0A2S5JDC6_9RHOB|nr:LuxR family transcriptional regulator [Albidovulum inexpectatum]PPB79496.1 LuxR family transcriptional regulator [Albidovulum inexpectatum]
MSENADLTRHIEAIFQAETIEAIWSLHVRKMARYGFDRLIYGLIYGLTRCPKARAFGVEDNLLMISNHDPGYIRDYVQSGLFIHAPMVRWAIENSGPCSWRMVQTLAPAETITPEQRKIADLNRRHGVGAGYTIGFRDHSLRAKGIIDLCASRGLTQDDVEKVWASHGTEITIINNSTHLRMASMPFASSRRALTDRQREVLEWVADGKTMQDIAEIMGVTPATVEKHLRLAREALKVETTAQAVLKASFQNQIFMVPLNA